nr:ATP-binding protein [Desulfosporosinus sp.]
MTLSISDSGCGIPEECIVNIFEPFFTTKEGGTGLGLCVCKNIVDRHKGTIIVTSKLGEGTTFTIKLPIPTSLFTENVA